MLTLLNQEALLALDQQNFMGHVAAERKDVSDKIAFV